MINVLSLFDGMSCGRIALDRAGIEVKNYYSSEVDKYAIKVSKANWDDITHLGDVTKWEDWDIDWGSIDLLIGGSPCQGFSFAGNQLAFDDERSKLFFVYVDILNHIKSVNKNVKFMLENVKMKKESLDVISVYLGVDPVLINSSLVSAHDRKRYYWASNDVTPPSEISPLALCDIAQCKDDVEEYCLCESKQVVITDTQVRHQKSHVIGKLSNYQGDRVFSVNGKGSSLSASGGNSAGGSCNLIVDSNLNGKIRKLTPIECERLQTVPDNYTNHVSNAQRYKMLGNGWTVDVIAHILRELYK